MNSVSVDLNKMLSIENDLIILKDKISNKIIEINASIDVIVSNWDGNRSTESLINIEEIKKEYTDLVIELEKKIDALNKARITYEKETNKGVETTESISSMEEVQPTVPPTIMPQPTFEPSGLSYVQNNTYFSNAGTIKVDEATLKNMGVKFENGVPQMYRNAYIAQLGGMNYLVSFPKNSTGETPTNLPVFVEFHGHSASSKWFHKKEEIYKETTFSSFMKGPVMGLKATDANPNLQAIFIMPQSSAPGFLNDNLEKVHNIYTTVSSSLKSDPAGFNANVFSAGGAGFYRYCKDYSSDVKAAYIVDPSTYSERLANVPQNIPIYVFTSTKSGPYNSQFLSAIKSLNVNLTSSSILSKKDNSGLLNIVANPYSNGFNLVNVSNTGHEELRDLVFSQDFFNTVLAKDSNNSLLGRSSID